MGARLRLLTLAATAAVEWVLAPLPPLVPASLEQCRCLLGPGRRFYLLQPSAAVALAGQTAQVVLGLTVAEEAVRQMVCQSLAVLAGLRAEAVGHTVSALAAPLVLVGYSEEAEDSPIRPKMLQQE